ncbi:adhesion G protein-coupled receptor E1-like [Paramisgurnus dabryanus]|uniref:adhesion G protein-coupled receptor E1-like n=1 Tax=Paramisgurnus dabryanus TaxID=90735 RepID=UPI0031F40A37
MIKCGEKSEDNLSADPCYNYTVLDDPRRSTNYYSYPPICDTSFSWVGWYRLFHHSLNVRMPESCVTIHRCDADIPLWLSGGHPTQVDGVVTRDACGHWNNNCCYNRSPIRVKACTGGYYVYEFVTPTVCNSAYCTDVMSVYSTNTTVLSAISPTDNLFADPCDNYTVLDDPRRSINYFPSMCDLNVNWVGWYRLFYYSQSFQMPETCVATDRCGTQIPLWLSGGHPKPEDGVVLRDVCGHWNNNCCYYQSYPIRVKACTGGYYVYEFVTTKYNCSAYCAASGLNQTLLENYKGTSLLQNLLDQIQNITVLPLPDVIVLLDLVFNTSEKMTSSLGDQKELASYVIKASEKLVSMLVTPTNTYENISFTIESLETQIFMVGPNATLDKIPQLITRHALMDIDLLGIAKNNYKTGSVAFMSYTTMEDLLKPDFFNTSDDTVKTMMSTVISATLPQTTNTTLTKPVNFTLKHIREFVSGGNLSCVYWNISEWIVDGCSVVQTNSSHTVCSCLHLSTFALIMQTSRIPTKDDQQMDLLNVVFVIVGLVFTSLALLTFAFCRWKPGVNNVARINLCISLLSAHLLFLLTQQFINLIKPYKELCAVISGVLHFFFLSCFVWMFIEAVLLFICVKNLSQISSRWRAVLSSRFLIVIGYVIPFIIVRVSVGLVPEGYGSEQCWIKVERGFIWSFLGPVCFILAINTILFISIIVSLNLTLRKLKTEVSQMKQNKIMFFKTLAQFVIFGCPWILGPFIDSRVVKILFLILNSQQGTFIFLVYCVLSDEVRQQYVKWLRNLFSGLKPKTIKSGSNNTAD